ncbi:MAG TPA: carboxypeptidase-like regulatory domain-containing protein [Aequorivita sp.]|nr:carboxypeptidase-like regulatory domain-containing protein [Aequorivita sp.]
MIRGTVTDSLNIPIEYANIGLLNKPIGTVSNLEGEFSIFLQNTSADDTLRVSCLGFRSEDFLLKDLIDDPKRLDIKLQKQLEILDEVILNTKRLKTYSEGKLKTNTSQQVIFAMPERENQNLGSEVGRKFKLGDETPSHLKEFKFFIKDNNYENVKFRINIYSIENGKPFKKINTENIFASAGKDFTDWLVVDLIPFNIIVKEDVIISVEWIAHSEKGNTLNLPIIIPSFGSTHYYKLGSQNRWEKYGNMSSSMNLTYEQ